MVSYTLCMSHFVVFSRLLVLTDFYHSEYQFVHNDEFTMILMLVLATKTWERLLTSIKGNNELFYVKNIVYWKSTSYRVANMQSVRKLSHTEYICSTYILNKILGVLSAIKMAKNSLFSQRLKELQFSGFFHVKISLQVVLQ